MTQSNYSRDKVKIERRPTTYGYDLVAVYLAWPMEFWVAVRVEDKSKDSLYLKECYIALEKKINEQLSNK